jgi:3-hydroxybutyryl-CoA dehydrogenase
MGVQRVLVVGAGMMGADIALLCARAGLTVNCHDIYPAQLEKARQHIRMRSSRDVIKGRRNDDEEQTSLRRLSFSTELAAVAADADFVIEAAVENLDVKRSLFADLDRLTPTHTVLATNSSSFVSSKLADATGRASQVCNVHFFNPALVMQCAEIVAGPQTSSETIDIATALVRQLGRTPIILNKEIPGFIANRLLNAVRDEAIFLHESGVGSVDTIDTACRLALGYPMGPFELMDLTGIDIGYLSKIARYDETQDPRDAPSKSVTELVDRGHLGRKTRRGWYIYDEDGRRISPSAIR